MRRFLHSRLAIAIAASVLTITAVGGITYATSSTSGDTYYACAAVSGMIRPSWIRLNTSPDRCPATTDHIVQWAAGGQPIVPKTGITIPLAGTLTLTQPSPGVSSPTLAWPAVDTSMCRTASLELAWTGSSPSPQGERFNLTLENHTSQSGPPSGFFAPSFPGQGSVYLTPSGDPATSGAVRAEFANNAIGGGQIMSPWTVVTIAMTGTSNAVYSADVTGTLYCTPY